MGWVDDLPADQRDRVEPEEVPEWLDPMLATLTDDHFSDPAWIYERKLDGERMLAYRDDGAVRLVTRNAKDLNGTYPELVDAVAAIAEVDGHDGLVLDGEVVAFEGNRTSFSRLQGRMQLTDPDRARATGIAVSYYVFDLLHLAGRATRDLPLRTRKSLLNDVVTFRDPLRLSAHRNEHGLDFLDEACGNRWEGLIAKRADASYRHGRSRDWLKFTCVAEQELVIGGWTDPKGSRAHLGALLVGYHEDDRLRYAGKVGTGYDRAALQRLGDLLSSRARDTSPFDDPVRGDDLHWVTPDLVAQVAFTEWTGDGRLRHPRYLGLRDDKDAADVVREKPQ